MAGARVKGAIKVLLDNLASTEFVDFCKSNKINLELLDKLENGMRSLTAVVDDAEKQQDGKQDVREWLHKLEEVVYRTGDFVDEICTEALQQRLCAEFNTRRTLGKVLSWGKWNGSLKMIERKIKKFFHEIELLAKQSKELVLRESVGYNTEDSPSKYTVSEVVFGRDDDKEAIISMLDCASSRQLSVFHIVGMSGIGKTTLIQLLYNDLNLSKLFDLKAWAYVGNEFDMFRVTKAIFESVTLRTCDLKDINLLIDRLQQSLHRKKFLIVLDDWGHDNYNDWEVLQAAFGGAGAAAGSCVIVITKEVATMMGTASDLNLMELSGLSEKDSWLLFTKFAFGDQKSRSYPALEPIGRQIVGQCGGFPIALKALGTLLSFKLQVEEWHSILESLKHFEENKVSSILKLIYDHLPAHLKQCFAYCSIFPRGYEFVKENLILLWMAEGLLQQPVGTCRMEEVGDNYFHELLFRSFFQRSSNNNSRFVMHDLMRDLSIYESKRFCFRLVDKNTSHIAVSTRYLSLLRSKYDSKSIFEVIDKAKFLRTFLSLEPESYHLRTNKLQNLFSKLKFLRVLSLCHYHITKLPDSIEDLKHLRYLDLSHTKIKRLPKSFDALCNLQTLILSNCHSLTELPRNFWKLINLRHLDINGTFLKKMPKQMGKLKNLQTLPYFVVGKEIGSTVKELGGLLYLHGVLCISMLQNVASAKDATEAGLVYKRYLDGLVLEWGNDTADPVIARALLEQLVPHTNLKHLSINSYCGRIFPHWLGDFSFSNVLFLRLSKCKNCLQLPPLGQLPSLKVLIIEWMISVKTVGPEFYGKDKPFQSLETLTFKGMLEWKEWNSLEGGEFPKFEGREFPCLQKLRIQRCPKLRGHLLNQHYSFKLEISESEGLLSRHTLEESLHKRPLQLLLMTQGTIDAEKFSSPLSEGVTESSLPLTQAATGSSLPVSHAATGFTLPMTPVSTISETSETEGSKESEEETDIEIATTSETKATKHKEKVFIEEYPSQSLFLDEDSPLPSTQVTIISALPPLTVGATEPLLPMAEGKAAKMLKGTSKMEGRGKNEEKMSLEIATTSELKLPKQKQKEIIEEETSCSLFSVEKSSFPLPQGATELSFPMAEAAIQTSLPMAHGVINTSLPMTQGKVSKTLKETSEMEEETETGQQIATTSETKGTKHEQKEFIEEDPSSSVFSDKKSSLPSTQGAKESLLLPLTEGSTKSSLRKSQGTKERQKSKEETCVDIEATSEMRGTKQEQKESIDEYPSCSLFSNEKSPLPSTQGATVFSLPVAEGSIQNSFPMAHGIVDTSLPMTQGIKDWGKSEEETKIEIETCETKGTKQEQKESIDEDPSRFVFLDVNSPLPLTQGATKASLPLAEGAPKSSHPMAQGVVDTSLPMTQGQVSSTPLIRKFKESSETDESVESEEETDVDMGTTLKAKGVKLEQEESNDEDPSSSLFSEDQSSLPMSQAPNNRDEADVLTNTWSNNDGMQDLSSFGSMKVSEISELMELPTLVHSLKIEGCDDLESIPEGIMDGNLSLQHLYIINCCSLKSFPQDHPPTALKILYIRNCKKLDFPLTKEKTDQDALLEYLCIGSCCDSLTFLSLDMFPKLKSLSIWDCANLKSLSIQKELTSLEALEIRDCPNLVFFLEGGLPAPNLTSIWLSNCKNLKEIPDLSILSFLQSLFINNCPELVSLSKTVLPSSLSLLSITFCNKLRFGTEWGLNGLHCLSRLEIEGVCVNVDSFPEEKLLPCNLSSLRISGLSNLKYLNDKGLQHLTSLKTLEISCCDKLRSLPEDGFPSSLSFLCIKECSLLTSKFRNKKGDDWSRIAHVACIEIDEEVIS